MKIGHHPDNANARLQTPAGRESPRADAPQQAKAQAAAPVAAQQAGVALRLSSSVGRASATGGASGDFDAGKVKSVKEAIENGSFKVDAEAIADKLLASAYETLVHARG